MGWRFFRAVGTLTVELDDVLLKRKAGSACSPSPKNSQLRDIEQANAMTVIADHAGVSVAIMEQICVEGFDAPDTALSDQACQRAVDLVGNQRRSDSRGKISDIIGADRSISRSDRGEHKSFVLLGVAPPSRPRSP
jgi:hypothetical protein